MRVEPISRNVVIRGKTAEDVQARYESQSSRPPMPGYVLRKRALEPKIYVGNGKFFMDYLEWWDYEGVRSDMPGPPPPLPAPDQVNVRTLLAGEGDSWWSRLRRVVGV